jgi:hypothetical protein
VSLIRLIELSTDLLSQGVLTKHDESFVASVVQRFNHQHPISGPDVARLREIIHTNT